MSDKSSSLPEGFVEKKMGAVTFIVRADGMSGEFRQMFMPYCIEPLPDGTWLFLNRWYKPLGVPGGDHIEYETHPSRVRLQMTDAIRRALDIGQADGGRIYLYDDWTKPTRSNENMAAYLSKLAILAKLDIGTVKP